MRRHSEEEYSIEPEVGVVIAKTTMQHIKFILTQVPIQKRQKKEALTVICTILFHARFKF